MATFEVVVEKTVWLLLDIEADTKEKAKELAKEHIVTTHRDNPMLDIIMVQEKSDTKLSHHHEVGGAAL